MTPIFLFSLPRSGSTLLQRVLADRNEIDTATEPWILLHLIYPLKTKSLVMEYSHNVAGIGLEDFIGGLRGGEEAYRSELAQFVLRLYGRSSRKTGAKYFLDKTPRYHLILDEIIEMFPEGKFIFLWRNPLSVAASISNTWDAGHWNLYRFEIDMYRGINNLIVAYEKHRQRCHAVRYEDLLSDSDAAWDSIFQYLNLPPTDGKININNVAVAGRLGDKMGVAAYDHLSREPEEKWKQWVCNPLRKAWCYRYLNWLGSERISTMGYSMDELLTQLNSLPIGLNVFASDAFRIVKGGARRLIFNKMLKYLSERI